MISALDVVALNEVSDGMFLTYIAALGISGAILLVLAVLPLGTPTLNRVIDAVIGVAMLGYGFYLFFIFDGGTISIFYYVFIVPILAIIQTFKAAKAARAGRS